MNREIENFLSSAFAYAKSTKASYRRILNELIEIQNLESLDAAGLIEFVNKPKWGNSSQSLALFASQKFLRWRYGSLHPALSAKIKRIKPKPRRSLNPETALTVLASFNSLEKYSARDLAIIAFGLDTGFRRAELCDVKLADIDFYENKAIVLCKGGQYGVGVFSPQTAEIIKSWLRYRKPKDGVNNLFISLKTGKALTGNGMGCIFKRLAKRLGFQISAHDLRSSFATLSTIFGMPSRTGQKAGRWSSIEMFEHYTGTLELEAARPYLPMANLRKP